MPCDGKNPNCDRRRKLLIQLKCLISSMDRKKPCEWDEQLCPPMIYRPTKLPPCILPSYECVKPCKSFDFRSSIMYRCECIKRNGLQDRCMMWDCMGRPECMTKLYPVCEPGRCALLKLTDLGDAEVALRKFYCTDQAREAALATYCRLTCNKDRQKRILSCTNVKVPSIPSMLCPRSDALNENDNLWGEPFCGDTSLSPYQVCIPPECSMLKSCGVCCPPPYKFKDSSLSCNPPLLMCLPS
ncbi:uncharacterized protein LOC114934786 [Nylanderia fulva]|uniref:uncharacterized protein LOC114934786 n=1 Tax=Nylanderia fulva TaxID=613905 RepID=UPI0010FAE37D|nr:uncharacterized protein LOC114934786 [Nylanderia fulva]